MHVLTFNSHQPYIHLLADSLPWTLGVVTPRLASGRVKSWDSRIRPLLGNIRLYTSVEAALEDSTWDCIIAHNVNDLLDTQKFSLPRVFVVHGTLSGRILQDGARINRDSYISVVHTLLRAYKARVVFVSALKQRDWGLPGEVILLTINPIHYGGYRGDNRAILRVSNHLKERGAILGWEAHQEVCRELPSIVLGDNPGLPEAKVAASWEDLKEHYRACRVYLHTAVCPYEDGYNTASLEAMATGMPMATLEHPTSPIEDGIQGVVAAGAAELRLKVLRLLEDPAEAARMGAAARTKFEQAFPLQDFQSAWEKLVGSL